LGLNFRAAESDFQQLKDLIVRQNKGSAQKRFQYCAACENSVVPLFPVKLSLLMLQYFHLIGVTLFFLLRDSDPFFQFTSFLLTAHGFPPT
jgi:hypothetical protein